VEHWVTLILCFIRSQAITCLKKAHYLNPLALAPACNLGIVFLETGLTASAAVYLCGAVASEPTSSLAYMLLGREYGCGFWRVAYFSGSSRSIFFSSPIDN
jgi:membrane-associated HD superfamily phosphohydrolase